MKRKNCDLIACKFTIKELMLSVRLGCRAHEQESDQFVSVTIEIALKKLPLGAETDNLADTVCYSRLVKHVHLFVEGKKFNLLEKFSKDVHGAVCDFLTQEGHPNAILQVTSRKMLSNASAIKGGVSFTY